MNDDEVRNDIGDEEIVGTIKWREEQRTPVDVVEFWDCGSGSWFRRVRQELWEKRWFWDRSEVKEVKWRERRWPDLEWWSDLKREGRRWKMRWEWKMRGEIRGESEKWEWIFLKPK
jgi:hypothetical protein